MKYNVRRLTSRAFLIYMLINIFTYAFAHTAYLFVNDAFGLTFEYISIYLSRIADFLAPPIIATLAFTVYSVFGMRKAMLFSLGVASARIFYTLPYYYLIFIYNYAYDSVESIALSFIASLLVIGLTVGGAAISVLIAAAVLKKKTRLDRKALKDTLPELIEERSGFDFLGRENVAFLVFALLRFAVELLKELIDTVLFLIEYRSDYSAAEILTILANYVLIFALLVASYALAVLIKNKVVANFKTGEE